VVSKHVGNAANQPSGPRALAGLTTCERLENASPMRSLAGSAPRCAATIRRPRCDDALQTHRARNAKAPAAPAKTLFDREGFKMDGGPLSPQPQAGGSFMGSWDGSLESVAWQLNSLVAEVVALRRERSLQVEQLSRYQVTATSPSTLHSPTPA
jgi:hypothetical protein